MPIRLPFLLAASLCLIGCASLLNSNRPNYTGSIVQPTWHNATVKVLETPVISEGVVYAVARPILGAGASSVHAFDLRDGKPLWTSSSPAKSILLATAATIFAADPNGQIRSLNAKTGEPGNLETTAFTQAASLNGTLFAVAGPDVRALSADSQTLWTASTGLSMPLAPVAMGKTLFASGYSPSDILSHKLSATGVYAFDTLTGSVRWKWDLHDKLDQLLVQRIAVDPTSVYVWMLDKSHSIYGQGVLIALDALTGRENWRYTTATFYSLTAAPILASANTVIIPDQVPGAAGAADEKGYIHRALDRATGKPAWEATTSWKYQNTAVSGDTLFVSDRKIHEVLTENNNSSPDSWLTAVNMRTGKELWRSPTVELGIFTSPAASESMVVVGSQPYTWADPPRAGKNQDAGLWAFRIDK